MGNVAAPPHPTTQVTGPMTGDADLDTKFTDWHTAHPQYDNKQGCPQILPGHAQADREPTKRVVQVRVDPNDEKTPHEPRYEATLAMPKAQKETFFLTHEICALLGKGGYGYVVSARKRPPPKPKGVDAAKAMIKQVGKQKPQPPKKLTYDKAVKLFKKVNKRDVEGQTKGRSPDIMWMFAVSRDDPTPLPTAQRMSGRVLGLRRELEMLSLFTKFPHPNLQLLDAVFESEEMLFITMPRGTWELLDFVVVKKKVKTLGDMAHIMDGILHGLKHMHEYQIAHFDLKMDNVVIEFDGAEDHKGTVKIIDFGMATQVKEVTTLEEEKTMDPNDLTAKKACRGTWAYMAPEVLDTNVIANTKADIWAAGCILYEMMYVRFRTLDDSTVWAGCPPKNHKTKVANHNRLKGDVLDFHFLPSHPAGRAQQLAEARQGLTDAKKREINWDAFNDIFGAQSAMYNDLARLVSDMLEVDPRDRLTATAALTNGFCDKRDNPPSNGEKFTWKNALETQFDLVEDADLEAARQAQAGHTNKGYDDRHDRYGGSLSDSGSPSDDRGDSSARRRKRRKSSRRHRSRSSSRSRRPRQQQVVFPAWGGIRTVREHDPATKVRPPVQLQQQQPRAAACDVPVAAVDGVADDHPVRITHERLLHENKVLHAKITYVVSTLEHLVSFCSHPM